MENNKSEDQQQNIKTVIPEELLELAEVLLQCKVCAVYSVLTLWAPRICNYYLIFFLVKELAKDLSELRLTVFQHRIMLAGHWVAAAKHTALYLSENQNPSTPGGSQTGIYKLDALSNSSRKEIKPKIISKFPTATCTQLHYNCKPTS